MQPKEISTEGPEQCQEICRETSGCAWFTWKMSEIGNWGKCTMISKTTKFVSKDSTKGIISGPAKCGSMIFSHKAIQNSIKFSKHVL